MAEFNELNLENETVAPERPDYAEQIKSILRQDIPLKEKGELLEDFHENDIAEVIPELTEKERKKLYHILSEDQISEVFSYLDDVSTYLSEIDAENAADIVENMDADDAIDVLEELEEDKRQELTDLMEEEAVKDIELIRSYDDDEIGSKMTTNFIVINKNLSIQQAMKSLIKQAADNDNISTIYTVNDDGTFYGAFDLQSLIIARKDDQLEDLIQTAYPYVYAHETVAECIEELKDYSEDSIPVLDNDKRILGIITSQDMVEVIDDELGDDYAKLGGLTGEEDLHEPLIESMKKRIPWLVVLLFLALGVSSVVGLFEKVMTNLTMIVAFQSLIQGMSGNAGTQSLAVTIRVISDEELDFKQKVSMVFKEIRIGAANGLLLGFLTFALIGLFILFFRDKPAEFAFLVSACIGTALFLAMIMSSFTGTVIPLIFKKLGVDPAVASGPLITTFNDLVAVVTYYSLAWVLLLNIFHL
ncbi:MAG: magnesium transporter [Lachnospiraceae bacterium]|nr:magnesium transporter [Lachnospiraceae bacterium]